jgi:site-specific DNA-cytosine methylase
VPRPTLVGLRGLPPPKVGARHRNGHFSGTAIFYLPTTSINTPTATIPKMVRSIEARIQDAMDHLSQNPGAKVVQVARQFGVPRNRLRFRLKGGKPKTELKPVNKKLAEPEEQAICNYIDRLDKINLAVRPEFVTDAANYVLKHRSSNSLPTEEIPTVNAQWTTRFLKRHNYFKRTQKKINSDRQASENLEGVNGYFNKLQTIIQEGSILPDDIYNMDETGFRIGMGKDQLIVTKRKRVHYFGLPENRESATAIECRVKEFRTLLH